MAGALASLLLTLAPAGIELDPRRGAEAAIRVPGPGAPPTSQARPGEPERPARSDGRRTDDRPAGRGLVDLPPRGRYASEIFLPGLPGIGMFDPGAGLGDVDETRLVQLVYDAYSRYSATEDGERARFTFHGFRTIYRDDFAGVAYYPDLVTLTRDWKLEAVVHSRYENEVRRGVQYQAEWVLVDHTKYRGVAELEGESVLDVLDVVAGHYATWRRAVALTSAELTVEFAGLSQSYRAGVVWLLMEDGTLAFVVVDNVVPEAPFAFAEEVPPLFGSGRDPSLEPLPDAFESGSPACAAQTWPTVIAEPPTHEGPLGHGGARYEAVFRGEFDCSCTSSCVSTCSPRISVQDCRDRSQPSDSLVIHVPIALSETRGVTARDGHLESAVCAAGLQCAMQSCPASSCGGAILRVRGGGGGEELRLTAHASVDTVGTLSHSHACSRCAVAEPAPE